MPKAIAAIVDAVVSAVETAAPKPEPIPVLSLPIPDRDYDLVTYRIIGSQTWNVKAFRTPVLDTDGNPTLDTDGKAITVRALPEGTVETDVVVTYKGQITKGDDVLVTRVFTITADKFLMPETNIVSDAASNSTTVILPEFVKGRDKANRVLDSESAALANSLF